MRIIGGRLKGLRLSPPRNLPVRPTTDLAKEALFNILNNQIELEGLRVLDLFTGTGNMAFEFASREAASVMAIDRSEAGVRYISATAKQHGLDQLKAQKADVFAFLKRPQEKYDLIFADPPYDLDRIPEIPVLVFQQNLLDKNGMLIVEHQAMQNLSAHPNFKEQRRYGHSAFSFFSNE
ncbi:MAG: RsmD family RNA methyltransferase [Mucilaginibacter polytrichastri]|nr:RsmD family RNA methyltransferase [Mucilaginibacter polytrichastri]